MENKENESAVAEEELDELPFDPEADPDWDNVKWEENSEESESDTDSGDEPEEADQQESGEAEKPAEPEAEPEAEAEDADQWIELKHMDDAPRKVSKKEATELAQKGLDYDRIRDERDSLKANLPKYQKMEEFLEEMKGDFATIDELMDDTRARMRAENEGISYEDALAKVKSSKNTPAEPAKDESDIQAEAFVRKFPGVKAEDIPASVWADVKTTHNLVESYEKYENNKKNDRIAELEREIEALKNNKKNADRSAGSSKSSGVSGSKSMIASLWDDDD